MPEDPNHFLPPGGNYQELLSYKKSEVIYDFTFRFGERRVADGLFDLLPPDGEGVQVAGDPVDGIAFACAAGEDVSPRMTARLCQAGSLTTRWALSSREAGP